MKHLTYDIKDFLTLTNSTPKGSMTMEFFESSILSEEMRRKSQGSSAQAKVLVTEKRGRNKSKGPKPRNKEMGKSNKYTNIECHYCELKGYIKKYCRKLKRDNKKNMVRKKMILTRVTIILL